MRPLLGVLVLCVTFAAGLAAAQTRAAELTAPPREPTPGEIDEARVLFREGNAAAEAGQLAEALAHYARAYGLSGNPAALFNAARTLRMLGRHAESRRAFDLLLASTPTLSDATREEATRLRDEEAARVAEVILEALPPAGPELALHLDGAPHGDDGARPLTLGLDAGEHAIEVELAGHVPFRWGGVLEEGARERLRVTLVEASRDRSIAEEPVFWIVLGSVLAVGAGLAGFLGWEAARLRPDSATVIRL